jgi:hypothetical protein
VSNCLQGTKSDTISTEAEAHASSTEAHTTEAYTYTQAYTQTDPAFC